MTGKGNDMETRTYASPCLTRTAVMMREILGVVTTPLTVAYHDDGRATLVRKCHRCDQMYAAETDDGDAVRRLLESADPPHVQDVLPSMPAPRRELFFMSGLCERCWNETMTPSDEEDRP